LVIFLLFPKQSIHTICPSIQSHVLRNVSDTNDYSTPVWYTTKYEKLESINLLYRLEIL
jgi:hypothetical protein